jgi:hypothetical protein
MRRVIEEGNEKIEVAEPRITQLRDEFSLKNLEEKTLRI